MLGHTKRHHIKGDSYKREEKIKAIEDSLSYDEAMKILLGDESQGAVMLRGLRNREGITQNELGRILGTDQTNISKMELGKRPIGKMIAKRLAKLFKTDYRLFL